MNLYQLVGYLQRVEYGNSNVATNRVAKLNRTEQEDITIGADGYETITSANDTQTLDMLATFYFCNLNYGDYVNVYLSAPSADTAGQLFTFLRTDGNGESQINVNAAGNYGAYYTLSYPGQYVTFVNDTNNWFPIYGSD